MQRTGTIKTTLKADQPRIVPVILVKIQSEVKEEMSFEEIVYGHTGGRTHDGQKVITKAHLVYKGPAKGFVTGFRLLQCYVLSNIFLLQTFKVFHLY